MLVGDVRFTREAILISQWPSPGVAGSSVIMGGPPEGQAGSAMNKAINSAEGVLITAG